MTFAHAGTYSDDILYRTKGAASNASITVKNLDGTNATLYTDTSKSTPLGTNVITTDANGNMLFYADPATYLCQAANNSSFYAVVPVNPADSGGSNAVSS